MGPAVVVWYERCLCIQEYLGLVVGGYKTYTNKFSLMEYDRLPMITEYLQSQSHPSFISTLSLIAPPLLQLTKLIELIINSSTI